MTALVMTLRPGESLLINGAVMNFPHKTTLILTTHSRFVFGKQIMRPEDATTPLRQLYLLLQAAYVGPEEDYGDNMALADGQAAEIDATVTHVMDLAHDGEFYPALKALREMIQGEPAALSVGEIA